MKALIEQSFEMGKQAFGSYNCAPASNPKFMGIVPNCPVGDDKGCRLRVKMYKAYIDGWTQKNLNQDGE